MAFDAEQQAQIDRINASNAVFRQVVANVGPEQWHNATVNAGQDVRGVVNHLITGSVWTSNIGAGRGSAFPEGDLIGSVEPLAAHDAQYAAMLQTFEDPAAWERTMPGPAGELTAGQVLGFREWELLHHAWDVAQATGQSTDLAPEHAEAVLAAMRGAFAHYDRSDGIYQPEQPIADDAPAMDRLAAFLGKRVQ